MTASLTLTYGSLNLTASPYLIEFGLDVGAPQNVTEAFAFLLQDGEIELSSRASNRTLEFTVLVEGANLLALATAEAALLAESDKPLNTLTVDPGDGAPASVFEVFRGQVTFVRDDNFELGGLRRYTMTVRALPFVRSEDEVIAPALAATGTTTTLVDNGSATTNWTGAINGGVTAPAVSSGKVGITTSALDGDVTITLTRTASITTSSTKYLQVDWAKQSSDDSLAAFGDGTALSKVSEGASPTAGLVRSTFYVAASSIASLQFVLTSTRTED